jgi:Flp pilus assembly protein CpaB
MVSKLKRFILIFILAACGSQPAVELVSTRVLPTRPPRTITPTIPTATPSVTPTATATDTPTATATDTAEPWVALVVAVQPIPAGMAIPPEAVAVQSWPQAAAPLSALTDLDAVINQVSLVDIDCYEPIIQPIIARRTAGSGFLPMPGDCPPVTTDIRELTMIAVAIDYIPAGATIAPSAVALQPWPQALIPPGALNALSDVVGATAQIDILIGQPIRQRQVAVQ